MALKNLSPQTISGRALALILPAAILIFCALTWIAYESARQRAISTTIDRLNEDRAMAEQELSARFREIENAERKAADLMASTLGALSPDPALFTNLFPAQSDGTRRSSDALWTGTASGTSPRGYGAFISDENISADRRNTLLAAFATLRVMAEGLPQKIDNLYFFSPDNDLLMYAPNRPDNLQFYRKDAPADLAFQDEEFSIITRPQTNPAGVMRCTSLQPILYDEERKTWTTGCMTPVRAGGAHIGAWGSSIPLDTLFAANGDSRKPDITQIVITDKGQLIKHPKFTIQSSVQTGDFLDLENTADAGLGAIWALLRRGLDVPSSGYLEASDQYFSVTQLEQPKWFVVSTIPGAKVRDQAFLAARSVLIAGAISTAAFALFLIIFLRLQLATPLTRLAHRADGISAYVASGDGDNAAEVDGEIARLDRAFDAMETRISRERLRMAQSFDTMVDAIDEYAIILLDQNGGIRRANRAAKEHFGWDAESSLGLRQIFDPAENSPEMLKQLLTKVEEEGRLFQAPRRYRGTGQSFWATEIVQVVRNEDGETEGFAYIVRDSSDEYRRVAKMEENLRLLNLAEDTGMLGHFTFDLGRRELTISRWIGEKFGLPVDKPLALEQVLKQLRAGPQGDPQSMILDAIETRSPFDVVAGFENEAGETGFIQIKGEPIASATVTGHEEMLGFFGIAREITEEKKAEAKLVAARDQARQAAEMRMNLLASLSHEIRTPMSGILGMLDQMRSGGTAREKAKALDLIESSSQALMRILDDVLQQARLESGKVLIENRPFEPDTLLRQTAELFIPLAKRNGASIQTASTCKRSVMGDPTRIQQILANFTSNAVKFVGNGTVRLECSEEPGTDGKTSLTFTIADDGIGIDPGNLEKLFEKFEQAGPTTQLEYGGTGLGLSICRDLARAMGGEVGAFSEAGKGSQFWLTLTLEIATAADGDRPGAGKTALIIEPAAMTRIAVEVALDELAFATTSAASLDDSAVMDAEPDVVIYSGGEDSLAAIQLRFPDAQCIPMKGVTNGDDHGPVTTNLRERLRKVLSEGQDD